MHHLMMMMMMMMMMMIMMTMPMTTMMMMMISITVTVTIIIINIISGIYTMPCMLVLSKLKGTSYTLFIYTYCNKEYI